MFQAILDRVRDVMESESDYAMLEELLVETQKRRCGHPWIGTEGCDFDPNRLLSDITYTEPMHCLLCNSDISKEEVFKHCLCSHIYATGETIDGEQAYQCLVCGDGHLEDDDQSEDEDDFAHREPKKVLRI